MQNTYTIGIDAGGTKVAYGLFDGGGTLIDRMQHPTDPHADGPAFTDKVILTLHSILDKHALSFSQLSGIGVCMPSYILYETGHIFITSSMPGIKDFPMLDYLRERVPVKFALDNDSNAAAIAEHRMGAGRGSRHMVYVTTGTGIGGGIIIDGKLFRGSYGWAGECGHMIATPGDGLACGCENSGCFMSYAAGKYIPKHIEGRLAAGEESLLSGQENLNCTHLLEAYRSGDALAIKVVEETARWIAVCVFNIYQLLNINLFVFGGGLLNFGDALFGRVRKEFDRLNHIPKPVEFRFAELGDDYGIIGAAQFLKE